MNASVDEIVKAGRVAWPGVELDPERLAAHLAAHFPSGVSDAHAADLYLACACALQIPGALDAFDRAFMSRVPGFVARMRQPEAFADDLRQVLYEKLFVGAAPKINQYAGRGDLANWLRVMTLRTALNIRQQRTELLSRDDRWDTSEHAARSNEDPELNYIKERYRDEFKAALERSLVSLSVEQREMLQMHFVDGLTLDQLASRFGVHRATIVRRIARARKAIIDETRRLLKDRLSIDTREFNSLVGLVRSRLDVSIPRLLKRSQR